MIDAASRIDKLFNDIEKVTGANLSDLKAKNNKEKAALVLNKKFKKSKKRKEKDGEASEKDPEEC